MFSEILICVKIYLHVLKRREPVCYNLRNQKSINLQMPEMMGSGYAYERKNQRYGY